MSSAHAEACWHPPARRVSLLHSAACVPLRHTVCAPLPLLPLLPSYHSACSPPPAAAVPCCRSELFSYTSCVSYAVLTSLISLDRVALKKRVVDSPEIRSVIGHVPELETCLNALYDCKYKEFFRVGSGYSWGSRVLWDWCASWQPGTKASCGS